MRINPTKTAAGEGCCGPSGGMSITDYIERGMRRNRSPILPVVGEAAFDEDGLTAQFSLDMAEGCVRAASFRVSSCATLLAYAEALADIVSGLTLRDAGLHCRPTELVSMLPCVPVWKRGRAILAVRALVSALAKAAAGGAQ